MADISEYNRSAWNAQVEQGNRWTVPVSAQDTAAAAAGNWNVVLTPQKPVPSSWFPSLQGCRLLALASGGGQQGPIFAAGGAEVTVFDNSDRQLEQDRQVAQRDGLQIRTVRGDMRDLSCFAADSFDLIFNPCSVSFIPEVLPVFREAYRVLRSGGRLMCGFINPIRFVFDEEKLEHGQLCVRHSLPYSDETHLNEEELSRFRQDNEPFMFSHSLEELIGGQSKVGFRLRDLFEDSSPDEVLDSFIPAYFATLAEK